MYMYIFTRACKDTKSYVYYGSIDNTVLKSIRLSILLVPSVYHDF